MTSPTPEVRVVHGFGLDIEAARATRIRIDGEGGLEVRRPRAPARRVASAAQVRSVLWLDGPETTRIFAGPATRLLLKVNRRLRSISDQGGPVWLASGSCVVLTDRGPVVAWLVDETAPGAGDSSVKRQQSGSVAIARGLGLTLEAAPREVEIAPREVRAVSVRWSGSRPWLVIVTTVAMLASLVLSARSWAGFDGDDVTPSAIAALVLALPVSVLSLVLRRRALRLMSVPPPAEDRRVYRPRGHSDHDTVQLQLGVDDVVVVGSDGSEAWLAGPAVAGGVATIQVVHDQVRVLDAREGLLHTLQSARFAPDEPSCEALRTAGATVGIEVDVLVPPPGRAEPPSVHGVVVSGWQGGDVSVLYAWLMWAVGLFLVVGGFAVGQQHTVLGQGVSVGGAVVVVIWVWGRWSMRRWVRSVERGATS